MSVGDAERANLDTLKACPRPHLFGLVRERGAGSSRARYRCERCGGESGGAA